MLQSALEHLRHPPSLVEHYRKVNLPGANVFSVGVLQLIAVVGFLVGLLIPRFQIWAAAVLAFVMAAVLVEHAVRWRFGEGAWEAVGILLVCLIGISLLYRRPPKRA
jgi:hypothetical protein